MVLNELLSTQMKKVCADPLFVNYSTGGLIGFKTLGSTETVANNIQHYITILKNIASKPPSIDQLKKKVRKNISLPKKKKLINLNISVGIFRSSINP